MPFAAGLRESLQLRQSQVPIELTQGESLKHVLNRHLLAVEAMAETDLITSVLLLSADGKTLSHGAGPRLPRSYCEAIDGAEIGPCAGSCGTAAFLGRPVYVRDISSDPLWADYKHLALAHDLRSCWSTPIHDHEGAVIGTFAIYHRTIGNPTVEEIEAIDMITEHVAKAILWARTIEEIEASVEAQPADRRGRLLALVSRLQSQAAHLDHYADGAESEDAAQLLRIAAELSRKLVAAILWQIDSPGPGKRLQ
jgi:GAF domain-containing protein